MPIYEYKCAACEGEFEYLQRISEEPKQDCERCGGALERLISHTSFQLKGSGWYRDLYSSPKPESAKPESAKEGGGQNGAKGGDSSSGQGKTEGGGSSGSSGESKPDAKAGAGSSKSSE